MSGPSRSGDDPIPPPESEAPIPPLAAACPVPIERYPRVLLAHGGGGRLMHRLIAELFAPAFGSDPSALHDSASLDVPPGRLAFTTDSYVIHPLFFPGGDIGSMAVHGTVNDLAMAGARPLYLSAGYILEEGLPMETLRAVAESMARAARECGVRVVTGDTKVVDRGKGDGIFINTAGVGVIESPAPIGPARVRPGDVLLVSGDVGRHGIAIMAVREGLEFETVIESDSAPVAEPVLRMVSEGIDVRCLRDLTRGGLASALNEIAGSAGVGVSIDERRIPVLDEVGAACEILGFDPLYVACEGRFAAFVAPSDADRALAILREHPACAGAAIAGEATEGPAGVVTMTSMIGAKRIVDLLSGEQLPRIC